MIATGNVVKKFNTNVNVWTDECERRGISKDVEVTVFQQVGLFLLHLLGGTEENGTGTTSGFCVILV
jgi:hypothetical protein